MNADIQVLVEIKNKMLMDFLKNINMDESLRLDGTGDCWCFEIDLCVLFSPSCSSRGLENGESVVLLFQEHNCTKRGHFKPVKLRTSGRGIILKDSEREDPLASINA